MPSWKADHFVEVTGYRIHEEDGEYIFTFKARAKKGEKIHKLTHIELGQAKTGAVFKELYENTFDCTVWSTFSAAGAPPQTFKYKFTQHYKTKSLLLVVFCLCL